MGGEKCTGNITNWLQIGSPPHGRGKEQWKVLHSSWTRITPAWAGKSKGTFVDWCDGQDHPRMGGEKCTGNITNWLQIGSPPHGRGKEQWKVLHSSWTRITPAWAGKSKGTFVDWCDGQDHPRMGGEKCCIAYVLVSEKGSPPHGRGKVGSCLCYCLGFGDHPRMGGEKLTNIEAATINQGSPPHGRGKVLRR